MSQQEQRQATLGQGVDLTAESIQVLEEDIEGVGMASAAVAFGPQALALAKVAKGTTLRCEGFVARRWRTGVSVALHVQDHEITKGSEHAPSDG